MMDILGSGELMALSSGLFWAAAVILFKLAGESLPPVALNLFKGVVALALFAPMLVLTQHPLLPAWTGQTWALLALSGLIGITAADTLFFIALNRLGAGLNAVVDCLYFPAMATMAHLFLGEQLSGRALFGGGLVIAGILIGSLSRSLAGRTRGDVVQGVLLGVIGMVFISASIVMVDSIIQTESVLWTTTARLAFGTLALVPLALVARPERAALARLVRPSKLWRIAVPASVLGGALAMLTWIAGFALVDVSLAAILNQLSTIYIFVLAAIVLGEPVTRRRATAVVMAFVGALLVVIG